ncbi:MFS transporter [Pigmentiphaga litoralis]|nr:MFS transporter [Pigmentiphaga litoralis]
MAQDFPTRPVRMIVPFPAGGTADMLPRIVSEKMSAHLGVPVIVENRSGAGGNIGADYVARAVPDGYTLLVVPVNFYFTQLLSKVAFDPMKFVGVSIIATYPSVLLATRELPANNVAELLALIRTRDKPLTYASAGTGTNQHLSAELFKSLAKAQVTHVPYRGTAPAITDLIAGTVDIMFDNMITAGPFVQTGKVKLLAVGSAERNRNLPKVPAVAETLPGYVSNTWMSVAAPPGTPDKIVQRLNTALVAAIHDPDVQQRIRKLQAEPVGNSPADMAAVVKRDVAAWTKVIQDANIQPE